MSSSTPLAVNSGPLVIRTYQDLTSQNTYLLNPYDVPVSSNRVLVTSTNGLLVPTTQPIVSSLIVGSTVYGNVATMSTLTVSTLTASTISGSTIVSGPFVCSSLTSIGPAIFTGSIQNLTNAGGFGNVIDSTWWGKYNFLTATFGSTSYVFNTTRAPDGTFVSLTNAQTTPPYGEVVVDGTTRIAGGGVRSVALYSTLRLIYNSTLNKWYSLTN